MTGPFLVRVAAGQEVDPGGPGPARRGAGHHYGLREVLGGNQILHDHDVLRLFDDAETLCSCEGTREIDTLIGGRAITGVSAFV